MAVLLLFKIPVIYLIEELFIKKFTRMRLKLWFYCGGTIYVRKLVQYLCTLFVYIIVGNPVIYVKTIGLTYKIVFSTPTNKTTFRFLKLVFILKIRLKLQ